MSDAEYARAVHPTEERQGSSPSHRPRRPTGEVTFLFTDLEGSTRRWEESPEAMREALARHDALLRDVIEQQGGYVFKTVGDAFCAAFDHPASALAAAREAQQALSAERWAEPVGELRVRMALHRGEVKEQGGDYFGPPLNRVARLLSAAHGGQVLLSRAVCEPLQSGLPLGVDFKDLGAHSLKDLLLPERVFQLIAEDLPRDFPPIRSLDARPNNLPAQPTPLVGREGEIARAVEQLRRDEVRLLTLTGPGGIGKTRLSLAVAAELLDDFTDGVFFTDLSPLSDPALVLPTLAKTLHLREAGGRTLEQTLGEYLRDKRILLVLDNFEQVLDAAPALAQLLRGAAGVKMLATSRSLLRLSHEREMPVPPLALPDHRRQIPCERLLGYESVELFVRRAQAAKAGFALVPENARAVAEICVRLDGLPLAIELAAARIRILSPQAMLNRLSSSLGLLTGGARDLPERQQTLRAAIQWSYELLTEAERCLFRRLGAFAGGWTLEAGEAVVGTCDGLDLLDGLTALAADSLVQARETDSGDVRFRMLETLREYARERLAEDGEAEPVRHRHAEFFLALAEKAEPLLIERRQAEWLATLEAEHDNLRTSLEWAQQSGRGDTCLRMAGALYRFWWMRGYLSEGRQRMERALATCAGGPSSALPPVVAKARAKVLRGVGVLAWSQGDNAAARAFLEQSLVAAREVDDSYGLAASLNNLANVARDEGELEEARGLYEESLALRRQIEDHRGVGESLNNLAILAHTRGDLAQTRSLLEESLTIQRSLGEKRYVAFALNNLGDLAASECEYEAAIAFYGESLVLLHELGDVVGALGCLEGFADALGALGDPSRTAVLCAATAALRAHFGAPLPSWERPRVESAARRAFEALGPEEWERAQARGRPMTLEQAVLHALGRRGVGYPNAGVGAPTAT